MISSAVLARYARALADVAFEQNFEPVVSADIRTYREIFRSVPELLDAFDSPAIPREAKNSVLARVHALHPAHPLTINFLQTLLEHHRIRYFDEVAALYDRTVNERKGIVSARVVTAAPLLERDQAVLRNGLRSLTGREVDMAIQTDTELVGGIVVQMGSTVYDGSVRRQLAEIRERMKRA
jgi:F-type H+-transporting ATPase subunit delta